jgi:hypothetical protein
MRINSENLVRFIVQSLSARRTLISAGGKNQAQVTATEAFRTLGSVGLNEFKHRKDEFKRNEWV